ncbi:FecR domain-containing protein [Paenibacillus sp. Y412MC10]|uniref:FecR domain-containing protein n=1 Tax=Geobacillus sp. (strain Y412MC10) TaxID=481743 RepID=UPI0016434329|nr:FecR domain-containing protein [Paenibacillus sp. Y412MC10]
MTISRIDGPTYIQQSGGALRIQAYPGMLLHEGDTLVTESGGAVLSIQDEGDEITLAPNSEIRIKVLAGRAVQSTTKLELMSGQAFTSVHDLRESRDVFEMDVPGQKLEVKGTQFFVIINPLTGIPDVAAGAGVVKVSGTNPQSFAGKAGSPVTLYPAQQISLTPGVDPSLQTPTSVDISDLVHQASPDIIKAIIQNKAQIDRENQELIEQQKKQLEQGQSKPSGSSASNGSNDPFLASQLEDLQKIQQNLNVLVGNVAKEASSQGKIEKSKLDQLIEQVNRGIDDPNGKIDLGNVRPFDPTVGLDPQLEAKRKELGKAQQELQKKIQEQIQQQKQQMQEVLQQQQMQEILLQQQMQQQLQAMLDKILKTIAEMQQANQKAAEQRATQAVIQYQQQLSTEEKKRFEEEVRRRNQERIQMGGQQPAAPTQPPNSPGGSMTPPVKPPVDSPVDPKPVEIKAIFSPDFPEQVPLNSSHKFTFGFSSGQSNQDTKVKVRVTYSSKTGINLSETDYTYSYGEDAIKEGQLSTDGIVITKEAGPDGEEGEAFTLGELNGTPITFETRLPEVGDYQVKVELLKDEEAAGDPLVTVTKEVHVFDGLSTEVNPIEGTDLDRTLKVKAGKIMPETVLGLEIDLRRGSGEASEAAPGAKFILVHNGKEVAEGETNSDGIADVLLPPQLAAINLGLVNGDGPTPEGTEFTLRMVALADEGNVPIPGEYTAELQWVRQTGDIEQLIPLGQAFKVHYTVPPTL